MLQSHEESWSLKQRWLLSVLQQEQGEAISSSRPVSRTLLDGAEEERIREGILDIIPPVQLREDTVEDPVEEVMVG